MIFIGLGANLDGPWGTPAQSIDRALAELPAHGVTVLRRARLYRSAPVPASDQPWFVNTVAEVASNLAPDALLAALHAVESAGGRVRRERWEARVLDLDLLDHDGRVNAGSGVGLAELPHPRLAERGFVLLPLAELAPDWKHPVTGRLVGELIAALDPAQRAEVVPEG